MKLHLALSGEEPDVSRLWAPTFGMRIALQSSGWAVSPVWVRTRSIGGAAAARLVLEESTRCFTETGHDVAVLFGIPDFYHRFGYTPALPVTTLTVKVPDAVLALRTGHGTPIRFGPWWKATGTPCWRCMEEITMRAPARSCASAKTWTGYRHGTRGRSKRKPMLLLAVKIRSPGMSLSTPLRTPAVWATSAGRRPPSLPRCWRR